MKEKEIVDKIIKEMQENGLTPDEMLIVIKSAREKFTEIKVKDFELKWNVGIVTKQFPDGSKKYHVHGHLKTESDNKLEAIEKYLKD